MNRICKICGYEKLLSEFFKDKDCYSHVCTECHKEKRRRYYAENKEHIREKAIEWQKANQNKVSQYNRTSNIKRKERASAYKKEYAASHKEEIRASRNKIKAKRREYYEANKDIISEKRKTMR